MFGRIAFRLTQIFLGLIAGLLLSEFFLGIWFPSGTEQRYYPWQPHLSAVFNPDPAILPGTSRPSRFTINSQGIRGDEFSAAQTYRILAIGGSTTESLYLDDSKTWTQLLQTNLNAARQRQVWVGNIGKSGLDSRHHIFHLRYFVPQLPKLDAVVILVGVNDLGHFTLNTTSEETTERIELERAFWQIPPVESRDEPIYKKTALWRLVRTSRNAWQSQRQPLPGFVQDAEGKVYAQLRERRQRAEFTDDLPELTPRLEAYASNLNTLVDLAQAQSVRLIFLTQPTMWNPQSSPREDALLWGFPVENLGDVNSPVGHPDRYYSVRALNRAMTEYNNVLLGVCQTRGVECVDLAKLLPRDTTVFYDDVHFNESGAQRVADALAEYLMPRAPFK